MTAACLRCGAVVAPERPQDQVALMALMMAHVCDSPELHTDDPRRGCGRCAHSTITGDWTNCGGCDDCAYFHGGGPWEPMGLGPLDVLALCIPWNAANCEDCGHVWPTGAHLTEGLAHLDECPAQDPSAWTMDHEPSPVAAVPDLDAEPF